MGKKFYAVKMGRNPGVYSTWSEAKKEVDGYPNAKFKSFKSLEEANNFITTINTVSEIDLIENKREVIKVNQINEEIREQINNIGNDEVLAFVDGSYGKDVKGQVKVAYGAILITAEAENALMDSFVNKESLHSRNVSGELYGAINAILWSVKNNKKKLKIYYDYEGIEKWATKEWRAKSKVAKDYLEVIEQNKTILDISFQKLKSHAGIEYNEKADELAKRALLGNGSKSYEDGTVYFTGHSLKKWDEILKELESIIDHPKFSYNLHSTNEDYKQRYVVKYDRDTVFLNHGPRSIFWTHLS